MGVAVPLPAAEWMDIATVNCIFSALDGVACIALGLEEKAVTLIFS